MLEYAESVLAAEPAELQGTCIVRDEMVAWAHWKAEREMCCLCKPAAEPCSHHVEADSDLSIRSSITRLCQILA